MKVALFPGSFNPWHEGHEDILNQALKAFDKVVVMRAVNPEKAPSGDMEFPQHLLVGGRVEIVEFKGLLRDFVAGAGYAAIVKGIRNSEDFEYEKMQLYFNQDLGLDIPMFFVIASRGMVHKSSTFIRALRKFQKCFHVRGPIKRGDGTQCTKCKERLEGWYCPKSGDGACEYDAKNDPMCDNCLHCHQPEERK